MTSRVPDRIRRALVTGASAGIGREFALRLAERGTDVALVARREDRLQEVAEHVRAAGRDAEVLVADLASPAGRAVVEERLADTAAPVDLLVNNAGFGAYGEVVDLSAEVQQAMLEVNVVALTRLARAALPGMVARGHGGIINVSSLAAFQPDPHAAVYGASKAYVLSFSQALHEEARGHGVRVLALCPGVTPTEFQQVADIVVPLARGVATSPEQVVRAALRAFASGRAVEVPGALNRMASTLAGLVPSPVSRRVSAAAHRAMATPRTEEVRR